GGQPVQAGGMYLSIAKGAADIGGVVVGTDPEHIGTAGCFASRCHPGKKEAREYCGATDASHDFLDAQEPTKTVPRPLYWCYSPAPRPASTHATCPGVRWTAQEGTMLANVDVD